MRTTVALDDDVVAAVTQLRTGRSMGLSEAVNTLIRNGLGRRPAPQQFIQRSHPLGLRLDVTNIGEALEQLDGPTAR